MLTCVGGSGAPCSVNVTGVHAPATSVELDTLNTSRDPWDPVLLDDSPAIPPEAPEADAEAPGSEEETPADVEEPPSEAVDVVDADADTPTLEATEVGAADDVPDATEPAEPGTDDAVGTRDDASPPEEPNDVTPEALEALEDTEADEEPVPEDVPDSHRPSRQTYSRGQSPLALQGTPQRPSWLTSPSGQAPRGLHADRPTQHNAIQPNAKAPGFLQTRTMGGLRLRGGSASHGPAPHASITGCRRGALTPAALPVFAHHAAAPGTRATR